MTYHLERRADLYVRRDNGVQGHGHRKARTLLQVRWHVVDADHRCVAARCGGAEQPSCGWVRRRDARAALATLPTA